QGVGDVVRGGRADVGDLGEFLGVAVPVLDEGSVHEDALDDAELGGGGRAEGEADGAAALLDVGLADQVLGGPVGRVVHAGDPVALVDAALVGGVGRHGAVPVEVVGGEVEHGGGVGAQRGRPVELVAGQLHRQDVVLLLAGHRVQQRDADVADGGRAQARRLKDGGEHAHGGGLAVGTGDREPGGGVRAAQAPGQFDVAPHGHPGPLGGGEQRLVGLPAGRGDDQVGALGQGVAVAEADGDA